MIESRDTADRKGGHMKISNSRLMSAIRLLTVFMILPVALIVGSGQINKLI